MVSGSISSLANFAISSAVNSSGSVLSIPSFWGWKIPPLTCYIGFRVRVRLEALNSGENWPKTSARPKMKRLSLAKLRAVCGLLWVCSSVWSCAAPSFCPTVLEDQWSSGAQTTSILLTSFYKGKSPLPDSSLYFFSVFSYQTWTRLAGHTIPNNIDFVNHLCFIEGICAENRKDNLQIPTFNRISMILENSLFPFSAGTSLL